MTTDGARRWLSAGMVWTLWLSPTFAQGPTAPAGPVIVAPDTMSSARSQVDTLSGVLRGGGESVTAVAADSNLLAGAERPLGGLWRSALVPGWGQWRGGHRWKAILFGGAAVGWAAAIAAEQDRIAQAPTPQLHQDRVGRRNTRVLWYVISATAAALDAYVDAHLKDFDVNEGFGLQFRSTDGGPVALAGWQHRF